MKDWYCNDFSAFDIFFANSICIEYFEKEKNCSNFVILNEKRMQEIAYIKHYYSPNICYDIQRSRNRDAKPVDKADCRKIPD